MNSRVLAAAARALCTLSAALLPTIGLCQDPNNFTGTCAELASYVGMTGVRDPFGHYHPGAVGITVDNIKPLSLTFTNKQRIKSQSASTIGCE